LERQANGLAHHLIAEGILPGAIVALCAERSIEMVVALVAILKAGAAYLPLDPGLPRERLATMLANAAPALILVQPDLAHLLPAIAAKRLILPVDPRRIDALPETPPALPLFADSAAYLIYTSGSTGTPKGVLNSHRGLLNRLLWMQAAYPLDAHDRVLQKTAYSFDVSVWEFFWPLIVGAELVMARPEGHKDPSYLIEVIKNAGITTLHFVPSMLAAFLATPGVDTCSSLKRVICSGEALGGGLRDTFHTLLGAELHNLYGPTEAAIDVTAWSCHKSDVGEVPIGRPIWNTQVHILDRAARPVPLGVAGEIYLGGTGLALGYYGRPDLTAERFVPNPFVPGERLYRTGDLGRRRPDGAVDYLGRMDQQVKIRGLRIELGEIEAALCACPGVAQAAVVVREAAAQTKQLVAFVVPADQPPDTAALRDRLRTTLPDYMVPAWITVIGALPLSPSGKLDRRALLQASVPDLEEGTRAPSTPTEMALARLFGDVLNVDKIDAERSFFEMGGDSLLALRLSQRIERGFGRKLAPRDLYSHPSVAALAALLQGDRPSTDHFAIPLRHGRRSRRVIGFLPTVLGLGLHFAELSRQLTVDATILTCRLPGTEPGEQPLASLSEIAAHCLRSFDAESRHDEMTLIGWSFGGIVAHEVACQLARAGRMVRGVILIDAYLQPVVARHETPSEASLHGEFETLIAGHGLVSYARSERGMDGPLAALYDVYKKNVIALREHDGDTLSVPVVEIRAEKTRLNREGAWSGLREVPATNRRTIELPADHYSIVAAANLTPLAALIDGIIGTDSPP
jgi:amino acid adenylation domain-containing protein